MKLKNLCPHSIQIQISPHQRIIIPKGNEIARIRWRTEYWKMANGIPIHLRMLSDVDGLPDEKDGVLCIVSNLIQEKIGDERGDLVSPDRLSQFMVEGKVRVVEKLVRWI